MAVMFYDYGEHPSGFVGFRVATTIGISDDYQQSYFGLSYYSFEKAERLANLVNDGWREAAVQVKRKNDLLHGRSNTGAGTIASGLRAVFRVEKGRKAHYGTYITPCFIVPNIGYGTGEKSYKITKLGLKGAYKAAVNRYSIVHGITESEKKILMSRRPEPELFLHTLRLELLEKGHIISVEQVQEKLLLAENLNTAMCPN